MLGTWAKYVKGMHSARPKLEGKILKKKKKLFEQSPRICGREFVEKTWTKNPKAICLWINLNFLCNKFFLCSLNGYYTLI